jgi:hypothetical protein
LDQSNDCVICCVDKASSPLSTAPAANVFPEPVKEVRASRGPRDPRLSAGIGPLPIDDDIPIASTSGHVSLDNYRSSEEPIAYNSVTALKDLVNFLSLQQLTLHYKKWPVSACAI